MSESGSGSTARGSLRVVRADAGAFVWRAGGAQQHRWAHHTDLATRRDVQLGRNAGPNLGLPRTTTGQAFDRLYPQVTKELT